MPVVKRKPQDEPAHFGILDVMNQRIPLVGRAHPKRAEMHD